MKRAGQSRLLLEQRRAELAEEKSSIGARLAPLVLEHIERFKSEIDDRAHRLDQIETTIDNCTSHQQLEEMVPLPALTARLMESVGQLLSQVHFN